MKMLAGMAGIAAPGESGHGTRHSSGVASSTGCPIVAEIDELMALVAMMFSPSPQRPKSSNSVPLNTPTMVSPPTVQGTAPWAVTQSPAPASAPLSVLVVDDIPANQRVAQSILLKHGHQIRFANNGREALELLNRNAFDVVLMDVQMPTMDGFEATAAVRASADKRVAEVPIIAMTAQTRPGDRLRCLTAGMDSYIAKPINAAELLDLVERTTHSSQGASMNIPPASILPADGLEPAVIVPGPIDVSAAMQRIGHDRGLLRDLAVFFIEDVPPLIAQMKISIPAGDASEVERAAHCLKGLAANFNAHAVQACAQRLEDAGRAAQLDGAPALLEKLIQEVTVVTAALQTEVLDLPV